MPKIDMPSDLGAELAEAMRWCAAETEMKAFLEHVRGEHSWTQRMPRKLLRWADRHAVQVFGHRRFVLVFNAGFDCPGR
jgi:HD superfamily phosphodiesterase